MGFRIVVSDPIHPSGLELLKAQPDVEAVLTPDGTPLAELLADADALIVRSETKVTGKLLENARRLVVIGRAGVGVDNIDLNEATRRGIAVVNAPTGNIIAAAEHTIALMFAVARRIPQAFEALKRGEWRRGEFTGVELRNKTLGLIGLGRVGTEVARRAVGLQMRVIACDPFVSAEYAGRLGVSLTDLETLLREADIISLHVPLNEQTRNLLDRRRLELVKPGAIVVNTARGGVVGEAALLELLNAGRLGGVALDVFATEPPPADHPLLHHPRVVATPHLGASTVEAQAGVAREVVEEVLAVLRGRPARNAVNLPAIPAEVDRVIRPYFDVAAILGRMAIQLLSGQLVGVRLTYKGEVARYDTAALTAVALAALLEPVSAERVTPVNARLVAERRGLRVAETRELDAGEYPGLVIVELEATGGNVRLGGTWMRNEPHIVLVNNFWVDVVPSTPYYLLIDHHDRPGMIGAVGTITGRHDINISFMEVGRLEPRGRAMMVLGLDDPVPTHVLEEIRRIPHVYGARVVNLSPHPAAHQT